MLTCSQCRFENPLENRFCQRCGAPLPLPEEASPEPYQSETCHETPGGGYLLQEQVALSDHPSALMQEEGVEGDTSGGVSKGVATEEVSIEETSTDDESTEVLIRPAIASLDSAPSGSALSGPTVAETGSCLQEAERVTEESAETQPMSMNSGDLDAEAPDPEALGSGDAGLRHGADQPDMSPPEALFNRLATRLQTDSNALDAEAEGEDEDTPTIVLPMQLARLDSAGATHVGRQRDHNEDYFDTQTQLFAAESPMGRIVQAQGLYVLCDGMGGHSAGEVASAMAVEQLKNYFKIHWQDSLPDEDCIREAIFAANQAIFEVNEGNDSAGSGRMGTTLVLMLLQGTKVAIAHVGDSRLYAYSRRQGLTQLTVDHEVGQLEVMRGVEPEIAYARPESYQLTQALGPKDNNYVDPEIQFLDLCEDTLFLLCSDGLSDYGLLEEHAQGCIKPLLSSRTSLEQGVSELIDLANELSGHDNITAIAIRAKVRPDSRALTN